MKVFIDAGPWIARQIKSDKYNLLSKRCYQRYKKQKALFYTNDYVLVEVYTRLIYDVHLQAAQFFWAKIKAAVEKGQLNIFAVEPRTRDLAWRYLEKYSDHKLSFADATIIANFYEYHLDEIFTFDRHFRNINLPTSPL